MSDNRRAYPTIKQAILQLYPCQSKGNIVHMLNALAALKSGIVVKKNSQMQAIPRKTKD